MSAQPWQGDRLASDGVLGPQGKLLCTYNPLRESRFRTGHASSGGIVVPMAAGSTVCLLGEGADLWHRIAVDGLHAIS